MQDGESSKSRAVFVQLSVADLLRCLICLRGHSHAGQPLGQQREALRGCLAVVFQRSESAINFCLRIQSSFWALGKNTDDWSIHCIKAAQPASFVSFVATLSCA